MLLEGFRASSFTSFSAAADDILLCIYCSFVRASCEYGYRIGLIDRFSVHLALVWSEFPNLTLEVVLEFERWRMSEKRLSTGTKMPGLFYDDPNCDQAITRKFGDDRLSVTKTFHQARQNSKLQ